MKLTGHCDAQDCEYTIYIEKIPVPSLKNPNGYILGHFECPYVSYGGNCTTECSILKQHNLDE